MLDLRERIGAANGCQALHGVAASTGRVTGRARIIDGFRHVSPLQPGDILVCRTLTRDVLPHLCAASGVITEGGGILSGPMTAARRRAIPAVAAVSGATRRIRDGQIITIDGDRGVVTLGIAE
jgi:pyruvate,water dikinase